MPRGGKRDGAGRKKGTPNKATQERQAKVAATGIAPLDVMLENMRYAHGEAAAIVEKLAKVERHDGESIDLFRELQRLRGISQECAKDAAPYVHPKLATVEQVGNPNRPIESVTTHRLDPSSAAIIEKLVK